MTPTKPEAAGISPELDALAPFQGEPSTGRSRAAIVHYCPLMKYVASRVATGFPANVEQADLVS
jgi:hypothetical protein